MASASWEDASGWDGWEGDWQPAKKKKVAPKRENKNQPQVLSSKKQVGRFRLAPGLKAETGASSASAIRDPRFDVMSGGAKFNEQGWRKSYAFLFEQQAERIRELEEQLRNSATASNSKSCKSGGGAKKKRARERILSAEDEAAARAELTQLKNRRKADERKQREQELLASMKKEELGKVKEGKGIFYPKKSAVKEKLLVAKYEELEKSGQLEKYMAKRRRKLANKQHKKLPGRREDGFADGGAEWGY